MSQYKNSLCLLMENYGSDEEDNENIKYTEYHEKETADETTMKKCVPNKLPLPEFDSKYNFRDEENYDDPELHQGRIRSFPHERGNWVSFVFIPLDYNVVQFSVICDNLNELCNKITTFYLCNDFHISLSQTLILRHHWIESFVKNLQNKLKNLNSFMLDFGELEVYTNDEKSRTFIGLKVTFGHEQLKNCLTSIDQCLVEYKLPVYYKNPSFHLSLFWCHEDRRKNVLFILPELNQQVNMLRHNNSKLLQVFVQKLCCKIGNRLFTFKLK